VTLFRAGISIVNETIRNGTQILANATRSVATAIPQAVSNYTACLGSGRGLFSMFTGFFTCSISTATQQFGVFLNTTNTTIQATQKMFTQLLSPSPINSTVHTLPQMAALAGNLSVSVAGQLAAATAQAIACIAQILNSTISG
jgi:hypothetical protein